MNIVYHQNEIQVEKLDILNSVLFLNVDCVVFPWKLPFPSATQQVFLKETCREVLIIQLKNLDMVVFFFFLWEAESGIFRLNIFKFYFFWVNKVNK